MVEPGTVGQPTPLLRKLGVRSGDLVLLDGAPESLGLEAQLLGAGARVVRRLPRASALDLTLTFATREAALERRLPSLLDRTGTAGAVWVCWPKRAAQRAQGISSDLDDGVVRALGLATGWVDVKVAAVDETWSGLRLVRRLTDR